MPADRDTFLNQLQFKTLTEEVKESLDKDITIEELLQAIKSLNLGKTSGPDGLPIEFYKTFQKQLLYPNSIPTLLHLINKFGQFSGYSINNTKSSILFLNKDKITNPVISMPFFNAREGFTYLEIKIIPPPPN